MTRPARYLVLLAVWFLLPLAACGGASDARAPDTANRSSAESVPTLFWLDILNNTLYRASGPDFTDAEVVVKPTDTAPDGVAVDVAGGKLYWSNMGDLFGFGNGTVQRADLDGGNVERIVEPGITTTPKQLQLDLEHGHVYWSDREGAKVWRSGLDGSNPEAIVSGHGHQELVGVALDIPGGTFYYSDKMARTILRANLQMPAGQTAADRTDVQVLLDLPPGASPIDLDVDLTNRFLYWTDRNLGTVQRAGLDLPAGANPATRTDVETLMGGLVEPIGIALDVPNDRMYVGELGTPLAGVDGTVHEAALDGSKARPVSGSNSVAGLTLVHLPAT